jgi:hypothetical protein
MSIGVLVNKGELLSSCADVGTIKPDLLDVKPFGEKALAPPASKHTTAAVNFILISNDCNRKNRVG